MRWVLAVAIVVAACAGEPSDAPTGNTGADAGQADAGPTPHEQCVSFRDLWCNWQRACAHKDEDACIASFGVCDAPMDIAKNCPQNVQDSLTRICITKLQHVDCEPTGDDNSCVIGQCR
jgi:hypothetical protein